MARKKPDKQEKEIEEIVGQLPSAIRKVLLGKMTRADANRDLRPGRVGKLVAEMDLDQLGLPVLSERQGAFHILDGQHRIEALKDWLGPGWETQAIECRVYTGLTAKQEADIFDKLNDVLPLGSFDRFRARVKAERPDETAIVAIVHELGLTISPQKHTGQICCVGTLRNVYLKFGGPVLKTALKISSDAYGDAGLGAQIISGLAHLIQRYRSLSPEKATIALANARGGASGLMNAATVLRKQTGNQVSPCVAAAAVEIINRNRPKGTPKLPSWWSTQKERQEVGDED